MSMDDSSNGITGRLSWNCMVDQVGFQMSLLRE